MNNMLVRFFCFIQNLESALDYKEEKLQQMKIEVLQIKN